MVWMPRIVLREVESIMSEENIKKRSDALNRLASYSMIGREFRRVASADRVSVKEFFKKRKGELDWL
jgi:hypothetical protein